MWAERLTINTVFQNICQGTRPWNALGDFLNDWHEATTNQRKALVQFPVQEPTSVRRDLEMHRWAALCAATVEYLCQQNAIPCPAWVFDSLYILTEPWFLGLGATKPIVQARLVVEAPEPFARRNIYCSSRIFTSKYEIAARYRNNSRVPTPILHVGP